MSRQKQKLAQEYICILKQRKGKEYTYTHMYAQTHRFEYINKWIWMCVYRSIYIYIHTHTRTYMCWKCEQQTSTGGASRGGAWFDISVLFLPLFSFAVVPKPATCHGSAAGELRRKDSSPVWPFSNMPENATRQERYQAKQPPPRCWILRAGQAARPAGGASARKSVGSRGSEQVTKMVLLPCLAYVSWNKTRIVKPLGRFHPRHLTTQDSLADGTEKPRRHSKSKLG